MAQRAVSKTTSQKGIFRFMDLVFPAHSSASNYVKEVECECCGISQNCTGAYIQRTKARFYGKWVCGLCSEAVNEESFKLGGVRNIVREEALHAHMEICKGFNRNIRLNPALSLAGAMARILKSSSKR